MGGVMTQTILPKTNVSHAYPTLMHIDLNSCFATIEIQANKLLDTRPVAVAAYDTPKGFVLAANYIAKKKGVKLGVNVAEARALCPGIVVMTPDPAKYRQAHALFRGVLESYSDKLLPKSIDEFVIDFAHTPLLSEQKALLSSRYSSVRECHNAAMLQIGALIKKQISEVIGERVTVNIGIGTNRFLAKYAAGFNKPDGMTLIDNQTILTYYDNRDLCDLPGINKRFKKRLEDAGILTPTDFFYADSHYLRRRVFKSILGHVWYLRLHGYESDNEDGFKKTPPKSIGAQYSLSKKTQDLHELQKTLWKLCEKTGRRLRAHYLYAEGIHLSVRFHTYQASEDHRYPSWDHGMKTPKRLYATSDIYDAVCVLLSQVELVSSVRLLSVTVYDLSAYTPYQQELFFEDRELQSRHRVSDALDSINNRYGEYVVYPAKMMGIRSEVLDRIAFGSTVM